MTSKRPIDFEGLIVEMFGEDSGFGEYRPGQQELARRVWRHSQYRYPISIYAPNMLQEAGAGLGKTRIELAVGSLLALQGDYLGHYRRTVIATNTIALREQITDEKELRVMREVMTRIFKRHRLPPPRPIMVRSLVSPTQFISKARCAAYDAGIVHSLLNAKERADWDEFYQWVTAQIGKRRLIYLHDWYAASGGKPLPLQLGSLNVCLDDVEDREDMAIVMADQQASHDADILVCTHTALNNLMWKMRFYDAMEKKALDRGQQPKDYDKDTGEYHMLIVNEANSLPKITRSAMEQSILFDVVREVFSKAPRSIDLTEVLDRFSKLDEYVRTALGNHRRIPLDIPDAYHPFLDIVEPFNDALFAVYVQHCSGPEQIFIARIETILDTIQPIIRQKNRGGASDADLRDITDTDAYPVMIRRGRDIGIRFEAGRLGRKISTLWRRDENALNQRPFKSVAMLSGTLMDADPDPQDPYQHFRREIGATRTSGPRQDAIWYGSAIPSFNMGGATRVIFTERSVELVPSVKNGADEICTNPQHTDYLVKMISAAFDEPQRKANRILVLFMSEEALTQTVEAVEVIDRQRQAKRLPPISEHLITQHSGTHFVGAPLTKFREDRRGVLFSLNWQGINAVSAENRSIVDHLIISKLPFPPANERLVYEAGNRVGVKAIFEEAQWNLRQGIGRAMRDQSARFTLWICDPRLPLPNELVAHGYAKYSRQRENPTQRDWYNNFDHLMSQRLFGEYGGSTGLFAKPVQMGYFTADGKLIEHAVCLAARPEDRIKITVADINR